MVAMTASSAFCILFITEGHFWTQFEILCFCEAMYFRIVNPAMRDIKVIFEIAQNARFGPLADYRIKLNLVEYSFIKVFLFFFVHFDLFGRIHRVSVHFGFRTCACASCAPLVRISSCETRRGLFGFLTNWRKHSFCISNFSIIILFCINSWWYKMYLIYVSISHSGKIFSIKRLH